MQSKEQIKDRLFHLYGTLPPLLRGGLAAGILLASGYIAGAALTPAQHGAGASTDAGVNTGAAAKTEALPSAADGMITIPLTAATAAPESAPGRAGAVPLDGRGPEDAPESTPENASENASENAPENASENGQDDSAAPDYRRLTLNRGDGLMDVLVRAGADRRDAHQAIQALGKFYNLRHLQIGQTITAEFDARGGLAGLELDKAFDQLVRVERRKAGYAGALHQLPTLTITRHAEGVIDDSLFMAGQKQGLPTSVIVELIRIFSFDVDFQREIRRGDSFEVFYERRLSEDGRRVQEGDILYARLTLRGKPLTLYRHAAGGDVDYYHEDGQSARKALMKTPIEGARLTSRYGTRRHPVLGYTRMHKGLDFGAPTGTPIMAAGDGVIEKSRRYGSYGNYVRLRHMNGYKTAYAHLSRYGKGIKKGRRVKQGQIIGYVGATGRVTGAHLHYEVLKGGKQINPLTLKIPTGRKLKGGELKTFQTAVAEVNRELLFQKTHILLAHTDPVAAPPGAQATE